MRLSHVLVIVACIALIGSGAVPASAATGSAWDSVTKFSTDANPQPGDFASDFAAASQPAQAPPQATGMLGILGGAMGAAGSMMQMMQRGMAQHHYVAGNLRRTDNIASQTADIIDCTARTVTHLDLAKKTYRTDSFDRPRGATGAGGYGPPRAGDPMQDDGSRMSLNVTTTSLGPKTIAGVAADGYQMAVTTTVTKPSGDSQSFTVTMNSYVAPFASVSEACGSTFAYAPTAGPPMAAMMGYVMRALSTPSGDPRITVNTSGIATPSGKFVMYSATSPQSRGQGPSFTMVVESANVHSVSDTDKSIFVIPDGFTKES